jgi:hypothetical protein
MALYHMRGPAAAEHAQIAARGYAEWLGSSHRRTGTARQLWGWALELNEDDR